MRCSGRVASVCSGFSAASAIVISAAVFTLLSRTRLALLWVTVTQRSALLPSDKPAACLMCVCSWRSAVAGKLAELASHAGWSGAGKLDTSVPQEDATASALTNVSRAVRAAVSSKHVCTHSSVRALCTTEHALGGCRRHVWLG